MLKTKQTGHVKHDTSGWRLGNGATWKKLIGAAEREVR